MAQRDGLLVQPGTDPQYRRLPGRIANLAGADLSYANLKAAHLHRTKLDTKWKDLIEVNQVNGFDTIIWLD